VVLSFVSHRLLRDALSIAFVVFIVSLSVDSFRVERQCSCLGDNRLRIAAMIALDVAILLSLHWCREFWNEPTTLLVSDLCTHLRCVLPALLISTTFLFGSPQAATSYLAGSLILTTATKRLTGHLHVGEKSSADYILQEASNRPIAIVGAKPSCRCVATDDLSLTINTSDRGAIRVRMRAGQIPGVQCESSHLIFDDSSPNLKLSVTALVHRNPSCRG